MTDEKYVPPARCPWCGGHARVRAFTGGDCVECDRCHASGPMTMLGERAAIIMRLATPDKFGVCSACGALVNMRDSVADATSYLRPNYCPNCGARVVEIDA